MREPPVATVSCSIHGQALFIGRKNSTGDVQVLCIVNFIPPLVADVEGFHLHTVERRNHSQHLLIVIIVAHHLAVGCKEGHIHLPEKVLAELVDVDCFVIMTHLGIIERLARNKAHDIVIGINAHHRTIHPGLVLSHQRHIGVGIAHNHWE